jgi:hypothetical protein
MQMSRTPGAMPAPSSCLQMLYLCSGIASGNRASFLRTPRLRVLWTVALLHSIMSNEENPSFFERLGLACRILFNADLGGRAKRGIDLVEKPVVTLPPEKVHASGLFVLSSLQQEGRLIDFVQQDVSAFSDEEIGAAARVVHGGCRKVIKQYLSIEPVMNQTEGETVNVPAGFDAQRIRLTGNVTGQPPYRGTLKHHGWVTKEVRLPTLSENLDSRVVAPAEVEL